MELNQLPVWKYTGRFWSHFISNRNEAISSKNFDDSWINHIDESKQIARITSYVLLLCTKLLINLKPSTDSRKGNWKFNTFSQQPSVNFLLDNYQPTFLPKWLLCRLNAVRASYPFSSLSMKRLVSFSPYLMLSLHPPHCQSAFPRFLDFVFPHLQPGILFRAHWSVISWVIAALLMAWRKAVSFVAVIKEVCIMIM